MNNIVPNLHGDWLAQRSDIYGYFLRIAPEKKYDNLSNSFFLTYSLGLATGRDAWIYNFSRNQLSNNINKLIDSYNKQSFNFKKARLSNHKLKVDDFIDTNPKKISWNRNLKQDIDKYKIHSFKDNNIILGLYRPFIKSNLYFDKDFNAMLYQNKKIFPNTNKTNLLICVSGIGGTKKSSVIISNLITDLNCLDAGTQCFPLYYFEKSQTKQTSLFDSKDNDDYIRKDGLSDFILTRARKQYGKNINKEDIFYYVYGILHSEDYRTTFANDLKKMLPRIPLIEDVRDFWKFSKAGRALADLHINYESVSAYEDVDVTGEESEFFKVQKMRFAKVKKEVKGKMKSVDEKSTINYNSQITISNIPEKAYEYVVNGKSAIEWIMERYQVKTDKKSGIKNDPNDWADEVDNSRYIIDLLLSIINVSVQTVDIVNGLPKLEFD